MATADKIIHINFRSRLKSNHFLLRKRKRPPPQKRDTYHSTKYKPDEKKRIVECVGKLRNERFSIDEALSIACGNGPAVPPRTYYRWVHEIEDTGTVGSVDKHSGRPPTLTAHEWLLFVGWAIVVWLTEAGVTVSRGVAHIKDYFGKELSGRTVERHYHEMAFSARKVGHRRLRYAPDRERLVKMGTKFVERLHKDGIFTGPGKVWCLDVTYTSKVYEGFNLWVPDGR